MLGLLGLAVDALDDDPLRVLVPEQQTFVKLACDVVHALIVAQYPLRDGLADLSDETLHIQVLQNTADNGMCEQIRGGQRKHQSRSDICYCLVEVCSILVECQYKRIAGTRRDLTEYPLNAGSHATKNCED